MYKIQLFYKG